MYLMGCEFEIANNSKNEINVSSYVSFNAYCDRTCDKPEHDRCIGMGQKW